ncbi:zinc finger protein 185-like [Salvelinus namaycush]|uniref:Zinc finger protein 185-like n=1 Tax=Salvelinus namaycush TaxID=8040 RepID=A0A8U1H0E8_SALNM|nr:zinc finger protein 185-like [Salvelinus namaycush]
MSKEGERASVLKTTKVRTKLKGDGSWMQRLSEPQSETEEEKPWMAEVRVNRLNGAPIDTSPVASPTCKTPPSPTRPAEDGVSTSSFTKRPSESYKRIAPHTVRPTLNLPVQTEEQLSPEEKEKREEAAMDVLRTSSARQRSYVLSAAKKYDSTEKPLETSLTPDVSSFVAKRVVITDNDDSVFTETPSVPKEPAAPSVKDVSPVSPVIVDTPAVIGPSEGMKPGCPKMATPLPELTVGVMKKLSPERGVPLRDIPPVSSVLVSPVPCNPVKKNPAPVDTLTALSDTLISFDTGSSSLEQELVKPIPPIPGSWSQELLSGSDRLSYAESEEEEEEPRDEKPHSVNENVLEALEDDFIPINTNTTSEEEEPEEQNQQVSLVTVQKHSSSYSRTLDSSANQRPTSPDTESKKGFVYLKEYVNATDLTKHNTRDNVSDYVTSSSTSYSHSSPSSYTRTTTTSACTYCGEQVGNDAKITIEHLNISCHPACFKCGVCSKPMGDFLYNMFLHKGTVHCESCYTNVL